MLVESTAVVEQFADALYDFQTDKDADPFDLIRQYKAIAGLEAAQLLPDDPLAQQWLLEVKLWHLVELLESYRAHPPPLAAWAIPSYCLDAVVQRQYMMQHPDSYELWLVLEWLQELLMADDPGDDLEVFEQPVDNAKWKHTREQIEVATNVSLVRELDADAVLRDRGGLDERDKRRDRVVFRGVYRLIQLGRLQDAIDLCHQLGNWAMAMVLGGQQLYVDPVFDNDGDGDADMTDSLDELPSGNAHSAAWRRCVFQLAQDESLDVYERAVYLYVCGDVLRVALGLADTWESLLLVHTNGIVRQRLEQAVADAGRLQASTIPMGRSCLGSAEEVLETLASNAATVGVQARHPLRVLQGLVILNQVGAIVRTLLERFTAAVAGELHAQHHNIVTQEPYLLRILTHLAIFLRTSVDPLLVDQQDFVRLLTVYALRMNFHRLYRHLPVYVLLLPSLNVNKTYLFFLLQMPPDDDTRLEQLERARQLGMPLKSILGATLERVFGETEEAYEPHSLTTIDATNGSHTDTMVLRAVEWFVLARMHTDAVQATLVLCRRFLLTGRLGALKQFATRNLIQQMLKAVDLQLFVGEQVGGLSGSTDTAAALAELLEYDRLTVALAMVDAWDDATRLLVSPAAWGLAHIGTMVETIATHIRALAGLWLASLELQSRDTANGVVYHDLRCLYIPHLVLELQRVLHTMAVRTQQQLYLTQALELAELVAQELTQLYALFLANSRLQEFVRQTAAVAADALAHGEHGLYV